MAKSGNDTKHTRHITRMMYFEINGEECNMKKIVCCEEGLNLSEIGTTNVREDEMNPRLGYTTIRLEN